MNEINPMIQGSYGLCCDLQDYRSGDCVTKPQQVLGSSPPLVCIMRCCVFPRGGLTGADMFAVIVYNSKKEGVKRPS